jgi:ABC-type proline/glycine betaine transport system ATPase subunit
VHAEGRTLVCVLHDLNQAARYADHIIAMKDGAVVAVGDPRTVLAPDVVADVFGIDCLVVDDPVTATPLVVAHRPTADDGRRRSDYESKRMSPADAIEPGSRCSVQPVVHPVRS